MASPQTSVIQFDILICGNHRGLLRSSSCIYHRLHLPVACISLVTAQKRAGKTTITHHRLTHSARHLPSVLRRLWSISPSHWPSFCYYELFFIFMSLFLSCCHLDQILLLVFFSSWFNHVNQGEGCTLVIMHVHILTAHLYSIGRPEPAEDSRWMTSLLKERLVGG